MDTLDKLVMFGILAFILVVLAKAFKITQEKMNEQINMEKEKIRLLRKIAGEEAEEIEDQFDVEFYKDFLQKIEITIKCLDALDDMAATEDINKFKVAEEKFDKYYKEFYQDFGEANNNDEGK